MNFFNKDPNIAPEEDPMIILDINYAVCMSNNGKDTKHTRHIARRMYLSFEVHKLEMFSSNPGKVHLEGLVHILR